jgi:hypothetical protein
MKQPARKVDITGMIIGIWLSCADALSSIEKTRTTVVSFELN